MRLFMPLAVGMSCSGERPFMPSKFTQDLTSALRSTLNILRALSCRLIGYRLRRELHHRDRRSRIRNEFTPQGSALSPVEGLVTNFALAEDRGFAGRSGTMPYSKNDSFASAQR